MRALLLLILMLCSAPAWAQNKAAPLAPDLEVSVVRDGNSWTADFTFNRKAKAWVFTRSGVTHDSKQPWRPQSWSVITPDVQLERRGNYDVLVSATGKNVPRKVRIRFAPFARVLLGEYDPALSFTDGSVALYSKQFDAFPYDDVAAIGRLPMDLNGVSQTDAITQVRMADRAGQLLYKGRRYDSATITGDIGTYVIFGSISPVETPAMAMIVDPQLPGWIGGTLRRSVPKILNGYAQALGAAPGNKPTVMVSWAGATKGVTSMSGSVLPELVIMSFEGEGMLNDNGAARNYALWFIAHESAHFWLGNLVHEEFAADRWIFEGGSDLLAYRSVAAADADYDWKSPLNQSIKDCAELSTGRGISGAQERQEPRAFYACGAIFGLVAEASSQKPFSTFIRRLIDNSRSDRVLTRAEWLAELDRVSGDTSLSRDIAVMLDHGSPDPKAMIASLFARAGVLFTLGEDGMPKLS